MEPSWKSAGAEGVFDGRDGIIDQAAAAAGQGICFETRDPGAVEPGAEGFACWHRAKEQ